MVKYEKYSMEEYDKYLKKLIPDKNERKALDEYIATITCIFIYSIAFGITTFMVCDSYFPHLESMTNFISDSVIGITVFFLTVIFLYKYVCNVRITLGDKK